MARTKVNKMELMRKAVGELGATATPKEIAAYFDREGVKISPSMISNYKSAVLRGEKKNSKKAEAETNGHFVTAKELGFQAKAPDVPLNGNTFSADQIRQARDFIDKIGCINALELVNALS